MTYELMSSITFEEAITHEEATVAMRGILDQAEALLGVAPAYVEALAASRTNGDTRLHDGLPVFPSDDFPFRGTVIEHKRLDYLKQTMEDNSGWLELEIGNKLIVEYTPPMYLRYEDEFGQECCDLEPAEASVTIWHNSGEATCYAVSAPLLEDKDSDAVAIITEHDVDGSVQGSIETRDADTLQLLHCLVLACVVSASDVPLSQVQ